MQDFYEGIMQICYSNESTSECISHRGPYLIFINLAVLQLRLALLLECDDNQGNEDVHEEEWKHYEVDDIEDGHLDAEVLNWSLILVSSRHRVLEDPVIEQWMRLMDDFQIRELVNYKIVKSVTRLR